MLPALRGPAVFVPHIIRVCPSDRWLICLSFYLYGPGHSGLFAFLFLVCTVILCFLSVVLGGGGGFDRWWGGGGSRSPVLAVFSEWSP